MSGPISAPHSIDPMVVKMKATAADIDALMERLATANTKLRASGTAGAAVDAFERAMGFWKQKGFGESSRTTQMAAASNNYMIDMHNLDKTAENWFA